MPPCFRRQPDLRFSTKAYSLAYSFLLSDIPVPAEDGRALAEILSVVTIILQEAQPVLRAAVQTSVPAFVDVTNQLRDLMLSGALLSPAPEQASAAADMWVF